MDIFDNLGERLKEGEKRWKEIDELNGLLKEALKSQATCPDIEDKKTMYMGKIIMLLVEEMRPMCNVGEQAKKMQEEIEAMLNIGMGAMK